MRNTKDVENLRAALRYSNKGYKMLIEAGRNEDEADLLNMVNNKKRAEIFFKMFEKYAERVEHLEDAALVLQRKYGQNYDHTMNVVMNELILQGYKLQK